MEEMTLHYTITKEDLINCSLYFSMKLKGVQVQLWLFRIVFPVAVAIGVFLITGNLIYSCSVAGGFFIFFFFVAFRLLSDKVKKDIRSRFDEMESDAFTGSATVELKKDGLVYNCGANALVAPYSSLVAVGVTRNYLFARCDDSKAVIFPLSDPRIRQAKEEIVSILKETQKN
jgi:hypothetical protein